MDAPLNIIVYTLGVMVIVLSCFLYQAVQTKNKMYCIPSGFFGSIIIALVIAALGQYILAFIIMIIASFATMPLVSKMSTVKTLDVDNHDGPLRFRDVFSGYFIPKLERIYGEQKALVIFVASMAGLGGACTFPMAVLDIISLPTAAILTGLVFAVSLPGYYYIKEGSYPSKF